MSKNAADYLQEIREAYSYIYNKQRALDQYDYMLGISGINYNPDRVQSSPRQDGLEQQAIRHLEAVKELRESITEKIRWRSQRIDEATDLISKIESRDQQEVLMMRYIEQMTWSEILERRGLDDLSAQYQLHKRALDSFQKILDNHSITTI